MKVTLATALINRGLMNPGVRLVALCPIPALGNAPATEKLALTLERIVDDHGEIKFITSHRSGRRYSVPCDKVITIDGMAPIRLAAAYDIKADGINKNGGKKRGRKPRINTLEQANGQT
jgi:hypothetical protein